MSYMQRAPGSSASGHSSTVRPLSGLSAALRHASAPPGQAITTYCGAISRAASADFSPSTSITGSRGRSARLRSPYSGRGTGNERVRHLRAPPSPSQ